MPDKKPKRTVHRVDPSKIIIRAELRQEMDAEAIALAILDTLPLLSAEQRTELEKEGRKVREQLDQSSHD